MQIRRGLMLACILFALVLAALAANPPKAPFNYIWGKAYHILPETHTDESGYFSLCEGLNGKVYVGTAAYGRNAYLVELDPATGKQRIVIDTHKVCGLTATGYAAQAKIHTKNFVGPSGTIYVGSKQGYRREPSDEKLEYPGGYVMTYNPKTGRAANLGMPYPGEGVIDVTADEKRGLIYVVTCESQHWMVYAMKDGKYREMDPKLRLLPYAATMVDARGRAHAITKDFQWATYDPKTQKVQVRPILVGKARWQPKSHIPISVSTPDGRTAYVIMMNDPTLLRFNLLDAGKQVKAADLGKMIDDKGPDSRSGLALAPDGRVYALIRVNNTTGFGSGYLHHLVRYDPKKKKHEDLGVLAVRNPNFFAWKTKDGKAKPWSHGYHKLPDGTLTPLHSHMGLTVARDNTVYATILYPFTLLKIDAFKHGRAAAPAQQYVDAALDQCDAVEQNLEMISDVAEVVARRHINGGVIDFPWNYHSLQQELAGRSGGPINYGRAWKKERTAEEKANDVAIIGWDRAPGKGEAARLAGLRKQDVYVVGFGPKELPELAECVQQCDAFIDTGLVDDRAIALPTGERFGRLNHLTNALNGWVFTAELVGALTRQGKTPPMWMSYARKEGRDWGDRYMGKVHFQEDHTMPAQPRGELGRRFLDQMREHIGRFGATQLPAVDRAAGSLINEIAAGKKPFVLSSGHMPWVYVGKYEDAQWMSNIDFHSTVDYQVKELKEKLPEGALAVRLGYYGEDQTARDLFTEKKARLIEITSDNPYPEMRLPDQMLVKIDMGIAFGDACVTVAGYPIPILPPSGVMQIVAYEAINCEVLSRLAAQQKR